MKGYFRKMPGGQLIPDDEATVEAIGKIKVGNVVKCEFTEPRNYKFHRKFFAMLNVGYDAWEPPMPETHADGYKGMPIQKSFERFRKDVTILAGFYSATINLQGKTRLEADSISFANMDEDTFERVYSKVADVILQRILTK